MIEQPNRGDIGTLAATGAIAVASYIAMVAMVFFIAIVLSASPDVEVRLRPMTPWEVAQSRAVRPPRAPGDWGRQFDRALDSIEPNEVNSKRLLWFPHKFTE